MNDKTMRMAARLRGAASDLPRALASPTLWLATVHLTLDAVVAAAFGCLVVTGLLLSASLLPVGLLGIPLWLVLIAAVGGFGRLERARYRLTLGVEIPAVSRPTRTGRWLADARAAATSPVVWKQIAYYVALLPLSALNLAGVLLAWSVPPTLVALPIYYASTGWPDAQRYGDGSPVVWTICGLAFLWLVFVSPRLVWGLASLDAAIAQALLGPSARGRLSARLDELVVSRRRAVDSAEEERRRIERDLHDGAQQRLVSLAMVLGRARTRVDDGPARDLIDEAHREAKQAIVELRDLTRGLHPPVLTDRGLDAALSAVAARAPVPVHIDVVAEPRPSATTEAIAYFVVAEALTNVAKHACATRASVLIRRSRDRLRVTVTDDGAGGADPTRGTGLAGLADRVSGVDGTLDVSSPPGGPTVLTVELPCES
jgi:signal transduction histidine kinase